jgi:nicotinate phosphoribosyltransferase
MGTMAHSWVMAFPGEEEAFRAYADLYPEFPVFLIDTYDTLRSGIQNAIKVGRGVVERGKNFGVRLDSGDMHYLTVQVRRLLDEAGLTGARITVSNDLDENIIQTLVTAGAPINSWGVGTRMVTGGDEAAFTGVYKLTAREDSSGKLIPVIKFSDNPEKNTSPGPKQVFRLRDNQGMSVADVLSLEKNDPAPFERGNRYVFWHPSADYRHFYHALEGEAEPLLKLRMEAGKPVAPEPSLDMIRLRVKAELETFDQSYKRILNPHVYKVSITPELRQLKLNLIQSYLGALQADDE